MFSPKGWVGHSFFHETAIWKNPKGQLRRLRNSAKLFGILWRKVSCINLSDYDFFLKKETKTKKKKKPHFYSVAIKWAFFQRNKVVSIFREFLVPLCSSRKDLVYVRQVDWVIESDGSASYPTQSPNRTLQLYQEREFSPEEERRHGYNLVFDCTGSGVRAEFKFWLLLHATLLNLSEPHSLLCQVMMKMIISIPSLVILCICDIILREMQTWIYCIHIDKHYPCFNALVLPSNKSIGCHFWISCIIVFLHLEMHLTTL